MTDTMTWSEWADGGEGAQAVSRALIDQRRFAAANREQINAEWDALPDGRVPPLTADEKRRADAEWAEIPDKIENLKKWMKA